MFHQSLISLDKHNDLYLIHNISMVVPSPWFHAFSSQLIITHSNFALVALPLVYLSVSPIMCPHVNLTLKNIKTLELHLLELVEKIK